MVKKLLHTRYRVNDLEKTVAFYKDVLGLQETRRHTSGRDRSSFFSSPESEEEIEICKFDESGPVVVGPDLTHLAFEVDDLEKIRTRSNGRKVIRSPMVLIKLPGGSAIALSMRRKATKLN